MGNTVMVGRLIPGATFTGIEDTIEIKRVDLKTLRIDKNNPEEIRGIDRYKDCTFTVEEDFLCAWRESDTMPDCLRHNDYLVLNEDRGTIRYQGNVISASLCKRLYKVFLADTLILIDVKNKEVYIVGVDSYIVGATVFDKNRLVLKIGPRKYKGVSLLYNTWRKAVGFNLEEELYLFNDVQLAINFLKKRRYANSALTNYIPPLEGLLE